MIDIDICCCTYNSSKWFEKFFDAITNVNYDKKKLHLYFTDNASTDETLATLESHKVKTGNLFGNFKILQTGYNAGFGVASNLSAQAGSGDVVLFYNVDTAIDPDAFTILSNEVESSPETVGAFELRQLPYEHPKYYNPVTLETSWASGAALALKREVFEKTGGFDERIFMYCEDVDLSWRIRLAGYSIKYLPHATTQHFIPDVTEMKPTQIAGQLAGEKILRLKYADDKELAKWKELRRSWQPLLDKNEFAATLADKLLADVDKHRKDYRKFYNENVKNSGVQFNFESGYEFIRLGESFAVSKFNKPISITFIVKSDGNTDKLFATLTSMANQTKKDFSVIVIGSAKALDFRQKLDIHYFAPVGNENILSTVNRALEKIDSQYITFINEGNLLFADFVEQMSVLAYHNPDSKILCCSAAAKDENTKPTNMSAKDITRIKFYAERNLPSEALMFHSSLYEQYGGFDVSLNDLAITELIMRYAQECEIASTEKTLVIAHSRIQPDNLFHLLEKAEKYTVVFSAKEIISLTMLSQKENYKQDFLLLQDTATQIENSKAYRIAAPFIQALSGLSTFFARIANWFGPAKLQSQTDDYGSVQRFVIDAQDAPFLNKLTKLFNLIKN